MNNRQTPPKKQSKPTPPAAQGAQAKQAPPHEVPYHHPPVTCNQQGMSKGKKGCLWAGSCLGVLVLVASIAGNAVLGALLMGASFALSDPAGYAMEMPDLDEIVLSGSVDAQEKILLLNVQGVIMHQDGGDGLSSLTAGMTASETIEKQLIQAQDDPAVKGALMYVNSPGGSVSASDDIAHAIEGFQSAGRPFVTYFGETAASGGYYIAAPSDWIVSGPTTLTGSIGVILETFNVKGLMERYGVEQVVFKSGENKDILNYGREITDGEREIMQSIIDENYELFTDIVLENREITESKQAETFDGRVLTAKQAHEAGLVDQIGYYEESLLVLEDLSGVSDDYALVAYEEPFTFSDIFSTGMAYMARSGNFAMQVKEVVNEKPQAMFLWRQ